MNFILLPNGILRLLQHMISIHWLLQPSSSHFALHSASNLVSKPSNQNSQEDVQSRIWKTVAQALQSDSSTSLLGTGVIFTLWPFHPMQVSQSKDDCVSMGLNEWLNIPEATTTGKQIIRRSRSPMRTHHSRARSNASVESQLVIASPTRASWRMNFSALPSKTSKTCQTTKWATCRRATEDSSSISRP